MLEKKIFEETVEADVEYLPNGADKIKNMIKTLSQMKQYWNIEILENCEGKTVTIEDKVKITVLEENWKSFQSIFPVELKTGQINFQSFLNEAMEDNLDDLRKELKPELIRLLTTPPFDDLERDLNLFRSFFGIVNHLQQKTAISYENKEKSIKRITHMWMEKYGEDKGGLEVLLEDIRGRKMLSTYMGMKSEDYLYGGRILSRYKNVKMAFEGTVDFMYAISESITINDPDILAKLEKNTDKSIKIVKSIVYPVGKRFDKTFFKVLKDVIGDRY